MEVRAECRIGSVPWFAGLFWLGLSCLSHAASWGAFHVGDRLPWTRAWRLTWLLIRATTWCNDMAKRCAVEGGAEVE